MGLTAVSAIKWKVEGLDKLRETLKKFPDEMQQGPLKHAVGASAVIVRDSAKALAPHDTGALRDAISMGYSKLDSSRVQTTFNVFVRKVSKSEIKKFSEQGGAPGARNPKDPFYWRFVELGTSKMRARSFMRKAFDLTQGPVVYEMASKLREGIARVAKKLAPPTSTRNMSFRGRNITIT